ncbi:MAG: DUF4012 domain-containing protein, partial [Actinomycetota bacterium]
MRRRIVLVALGATAIVAGLCLYVALSVALDLTTARRVLFKDPQRLETADVNEARERLDRAAETLESPPAKLVGWLPVVHQNFAAVQAVVEDAGPLLRAAQKLAHAVQAARDEDVVEDGAVDLDLVTRLEEPLREQGAAAGDLADTVEAHRNGWLLPLLWSEMDELAARVRGLEGSTRTAAELTSLAPQMFGRDGDRTYLVALMNNTELRGAGGILSGVGSVTVRGGRMSLGEFTHYGALADDPPFRKVPAPPDFERHFGTYKADTTRWVTATSSPDLPDVALVARRLFQKTAGVDTDGVIFVDPRGLAAMMPPEVELEVPTTDTSLTAAELPLYVYRDAYSELGGGAARRRDSLIGLGAEAFDVILKRGFNRPAVIRSTAEAFAGGHISMVSFDPEEAGALDRAGLSRDLGDPVYDGALATVQNVGGNKLDSYARRSVHHACRIDGENPTRCVTDVAIANHTPPGLSRFEHQYLPYGLFKNVVEIYVPKEAELASVETDGERADFFEADEDGFSAVGVYVELPRNQRTEVSVVYELPPA